MWSWGLLMVGIFRSEVRQAHEGIGRGGRPWERSGAVDVERLLHWAYGAQMVERFERVGLHAIEAAAAGYEPRGVSGDGVGQLMAIEHMGCRIDRGSGLVGDCVHPVALVVAAAVAALGEPGREVKRYAVAGTRPMTWRPPEQPIRARVWVKEGKTAQVEYQGPGRKGAYCSVLIAWDKAREQWGRAHYAEWHAALGDLAWQLSTRALGFEVTGPEAPAEPWLEAKRAEASSIALDLRPEGTPPAGPPGAMRNQ